MAYPDGYSAAHSPDAAPRAKMNSYTIRLCRYVDIEINAECEDEAIEYSKECLSDLRRQQLHYRGFGEVIVDEFVIEEIE